MISEADAFRGRWAVHPVGWALLFVPIIALVALQETSIGSPDLALALASGIVQHAVGGGLIVGVGGLLLRRLGQIPLAVTFALWTASGVARGIAGGLIAEQVAQQPPEYAYRIAYWCLVTLIWMPLCSYLLAQLEVRPIVASEVERAHNELTLTRERVSRSAAQRKADLISAVRDSVAPLVADVRQALANAADEDDEIELDAIGTRLEAVAHEVHVVIEPPAAAPTPAQGRARPQFSTLVDALEFSRDRPVFAATLTTIAVAALFLPESFRGGNWIDVAVDSLGIAAGSITLTAGLFVARAARQFTPRHALLVFLASSLAAQLIPLAHAAQQNGVRDLWLVVAVPLAFGSAAVLLSASVALGEGNVKRFALLKALEDETAAVVEGARARDELAAVQVAEVMHGPILGRLSACIMALNFYLAEPEHRRGLRRTATTEGVLAHLELVARDLEKLALSAK